MASSKGRPDAAVYVHGRGGSPEEAEHYKPLFPCCEVFGLDYKGVTPWEAGKEIHDAIAVLKTRFRRVSLIANSIGAFFSMNAEIETDVAHAYFISPIVDMEKLVIGMMERAAVTEPELQEKGIVQTGFGEELSWEYLCYVRSHPISWDVPTDILWGSRDGLTSIDTITSFAAAHHASLTVMENGEHWFHTRAQMRFLDDWIREKTIKEINNGSE